MGQVEISRRALLGTGLAAGSALALAGCGPNGAGSDTGGPDDGSDNFTMPTHVPYDGPKPDLAGDVEAGIPGGYLGYPDPPPSTGEVPLGLSKPVQFLMQGSAPAVPMDRNVWWKQWNTDVGAEVQLSAVGSSEYTAKFQTSVAGDALGDFTQIITVPQLPQVLEKLFCDLTPYLSGDAVAKYPNLANFPTSAWEVAKVNGKLWGIPQPRVVAGLVVLTRGDHLESRGIDLMPQLTDGEAFLDLCREVNDPGAGIFPIGQLPQNWTVPVVLEALGGPNGWRVENGTWTSAFETPEYERALEIVTEMYQEKLFHPNSYSDLGGTHTWFNAGVTTLFSQNFANWQQKAGMLDVPIGAVVMPKWDGGGVAPKHLGAPAYSAPVGLKKIDDEQRIDELLRVADYIASPFGTEEHLRVNYGVEGRQWTVADGDLKVDPDAPEELVRGLTYCGSSTWRDLYTPSRPDMTKLIHQYCADLIPDGVADPSRGRYSETEVTKGPVAARRLNDLQGNIIQGRAKLTEWADAVKDWKQTAGDAIAREYADQG